MKYIVEVNIDGYLEIEADSKEEAEAKVKDGYSMSNVQYQDDQIIDIYLERG